MSAIRHFSAWLPIRRSGMIDRDAIAKGVRGAMESATYMRSRFPLLA